MQDSRYKSNNHYALGDLIHVVSLESEEVLSRKVENSEDLKTLNSEGLGVWCVTSHLYKDGRTAHLSTQISLEPTNLN